MRNYDARGLAQSLLASNGGVGAALAVQPQYVGAPLAVQPQFYGQQQYGQNIGAPVQYVQTGPQTLGRPVDVSPEAYVDGGLTYLGFGATNIAAGANNIIVPITTDRPFTPQHLRCPSTNFGLLINQVQLEGTNLFANQAGVPIELFSEVSTAQQMPWPTLDTSTGISFVVSNPTGAAISFQGGFYGTQVRR
jgi:hypothetical protein